MPAPQTGSPMTYVHNGKQYIVVAVSGGPYWANTLHTLALGVGMNFLRLGSTVTLSCALFFFLPFARKSQQRRRRVPSGTAFIQKTKRSAASPFITRSVRPVTAIN